MIKDVIEQENREMPENVVKQIGACKFCGQLTQIYALDRWDKDSLNEVATELCPCEDALRYSARKNRREVAKELIEQKFGHGVDAQPQDVQDLLYANAEAIIEEKISKVTTVLDSKTKCVITMTAKGAIRIEKTVTDKESTTL